jgi:hypothetical protein
MLNRRSGILTAMIALACLPGSPLTSSAEEVESILRHAMRLCPDLYHAETYDALMADVKATALAGPSFEHAARRVADDFEAWANGGRRPIILRDEPASGEWLARISFAGPGIYRAEAYRRAALPGERGEVIVMEATNRPAAWERAVKEAKDRDLANQVARLSASMGRDVRPEIDVLMAGRVVPSWRDMKAALEQAAGQQASESAVLVGVDEAGPHTPIEEFTADEFTRRYGIHDDFVKEPPSAEQRAKMVAWLDSVNARLRADMGGWHPEDAADLAARFTPAPDRPVDKGIREDLTPLQAYTLRELVVGPFTFQRGDARGGADTGEVIYVDGWKTFDLQDEGRAFTPAQTGGADHREALKRVTASDDEIRAAIEGARAGGFWERSLRWRARLDPAGGNTLTLAKMREAVAELELNAIPPRADGMYRVPRFDDPDIQAAIREHDVTGRAFSAAMSDGMQGRDRGLSVREYMEEAGRDHAAFVAVDMARAPETEFERAQRMAMNTSVDRAMVGKTGPIDFKLAGEINRLRRTPLYEAQPAREPYLPRYSAKPRPKVTRDPEVKRERKAGKAARTAAKKRRGWA